MKLHTAYFISSVGIVLLVSLYLFPVPHTASWLLFQLNAIRFLGGIIFYGTGMVQGAEIKRKAWLEEHP